MGFVIEHKEAIVALVVVFLGLLWFGWVLSGPSKEEKQEERRRLEVDAQRQALRAQENNRLAKLRGQKSGRSTRIVPINRKAGGRNG